MGNRGFSAKTGDGTAHPLMLRQRKAKKFRKIINSAAFQWITPESRNLGRAFCVSKNMRNLLAALLSGCEKRLGELVLRR
jgi:predicted flavoprotein YhiN